MRKITRTAMIVAVLAMLTAAASYAQGQSGGGQFSQFREQHKYTFQLMQMVRHTEEINKDPKYALTPAQSKQVLAVLKPLTTKPKLTEDQAKDALKGLKKIFTVTQLNAMAKIKAPQHRMGGSGGPGAPGAPGGQRGGAQGNRPHFDPNAMKDFNPFYTKVDKSNPMMVDRAKRTTEFLSSLEKKAGGKSAPAKNAPKSTSKSVSKSAPKKK